VALAPDVRRVLVALSGTGDEWAALDAAVDLAERLQAELATLFIEDVDLLRASLLPGMREIGRLSAQSRQLDFGQMERTLKAAASAAESRLRQTAQARALRFSFQVLRGRPVPQLLSRAGRWDLVLLAPPAWERRRRPAISPIALYYDASAEAEAALALAASLARDTGVPLHLMIPAGTETAFQQRLAQARSHAPGLTLSAEHCRAADLLERLAQQNAGLVILPGTEAFDAAALDRLRQRVRCDLLVVR